MSIKGFLYKLFFIVFLFLSNSRVLLAQDSTALPTNAKVLSAKQLTAINDKAISYNNKIDKQTEKYLRKIQKQEAKLKNKLMKVDSTAAKQLFDESQAYYTNLQNKLKDKTNKIKTARVTQYLPGLDSMTTSLQFLKDNAAFTSTLKNANTKITDALGNYKELQNKLEVTKDITQFIKERKAMLQQALQKYNVGKKLKKYSQSVYYYEAQMSEYKKMLRNPQKLQKELISTIVKLPFFKEYFQKNTILASFFNANQSTNYRNETFDLQERNGVMKLIDEKIKSAEGKGQETISTRVTEAKEQLSKIKEKMSVDYLKKQFRINTQKTLPPKKRLVYDLDFSSNSKSILISHTSSIGVNVGYKLNDSKIINIGIISKIGVEDKLKKISYQGIVLQSSILWDVWNKTYLTGSYESSHFTNGFTYIQNNFLLGLTKNYYISSKCRGRIQLLYRFKNKVEFYSTPISLRTGFSF
jgi:hypothetical protein